MSSSSIPVLIVDDDRTIAAVLKQVIQQLGGGFTCETVWANTGMAAREAIKTQHFQLVLLDYLLPDEDGLALLSAINRLPDSKRPVVIMLTGAGNEQVAVEAMKMGAKDYIVKTQLDFLALRRSIVTALEHRRLEEKLARSTEELRRKNVEMEADLALARGVQQALLPQSYPVFPVGVAAERSVLQFCHRWIPSEKVAGDLFDVFPVGANAAGIFLCDVMGHGVRAALITALLRGLVREQIRLADRPGMFLAEINRGLQALLGQTGDFVFVTAAYVMVEATSGRVRGAIAGHPAPLHLRRRAGVVVPLVHPDGPGPALGLLSDPVYDELELWLEPGDAVLLFTDGLYEAADIAGVEYSQSQLRAAVEARLVHSTPSLIDAVLAEVRQFQGGRATGNFVDDVCLVAVDRAGERTLEHIK